MIGIYELKHSGDGLRVEYTDGKDVLRVITFDRPREEFYQSEQNILRYALEYFGLVGIACNLRSVKWSTGDKPGTKIELNVTTATGEFGRLTLPKIDNAILKDEENGEPMLCPKNWYLGHIEAFEIEIGEFIKGKKAQLALPFDETLPESEDEGEDGEDGITEGSGQQIVPPPTRRKAAKIA